MADPLLNAVVAVAFTVAAMYMVIWLFTYARGRPSLGRRIVSLFDLGQAPKGEGRYSLRYAFVVVAILVACEAVAGLQLWDATNASSPVATAIWIGHFAAVVAWSAVLWQRTTPTS